MRGRKLVVKEIVISNFREKTARRIGVCDCLVVQTNGSIRAFSATRQGIKHCRWIIQSSYGPTNVKATLRRSLRGNQGPMVCLPETGAVLWLQEFRQTSGSGAPTIRGTIEMLEGGEQFPICCQGGSFCQPADMYPGEHESICVSLQKLLDRTKGLLPIHMVATEEEKR